MKQIFNSLYKKIDVSLTGFSHFCNTVIQDIFKTKRSISKLQEQYFMLGKKEYWTYFYAYLKLWKLVDTLSQVQWA